MQQISKRNYNLNYLIGVILTASLGSFVSGYEMGVFNTCQRNVAKTLNWGSQADTYISIINAIFPIGTLSGCLLAGPVSNKLGRKLGNLLTAFTYILGCGINIIPNLSAFYIARFISGIGTGLSLSIVPIFSKLYIVVELAPSEISGMLGSVTQLMLTFGIFVSYAMGIPLPVSDLTSNLNEWWIAMFLLPIPIGIIQILLILFVYPVETPKWLKKQGKGEQADVVLSKIYINYQADNQLKLIGINEEVDITSEIVSQPSYKELLCSSYIRITLIGCTLCILNQFTGMGIFIGYSSRIFNKTGGSQDYANYFTAALGFFNMITVLIGTCLVDSNIYSELGRRLVMIQGCAGMMICMILLGTAVIYNCSAYMQLVIILLFVAFFESSLGPLLFVYLGEIMTDKGISIAMAMNALCSALIGGVYPTLSAALGLAKTFYFFGICCGVFLLFVTLFCIETKGKTFDEIQSLLLRKSAKSLKIDS